MIDGFYLVICAFFLFYAASFLFSCFPMSFSIKHILSLFLFGKLHIALIL